MKTFVPILLMLVAVGALTACGSDAASRTPTILAAAPVASGTDDGTRPAPADGTGGTEGAAADAVDVCGLMPASNVAMMAGKAVDIATPDVTSGPGEHMCLYSDTEGGNAMSIWVNATTGSQAYDAALASVGSAAKQVAGVGDKAFSSVLGLQVLSGTTLIKVTGVDDVAAASELARTLAYQL